MVAEALKKILERAVRMEESSFELYDSASRRVRDPGAKTGLRELAGEEKKHRELLEGLLQGNLDRAVSRGRREAIQDLRIGESLEAKHLTPESTLQEVLAFAIKRETTARDFYAQMVELLDPGPERELFEMLVREESRHKATVENLYEQDIYQDF